MTMQIITNSCFIILLHCAYVQIKLFYSNNILNQEWFSIVFCMAERKIFVYAIHISVALIFFSFTVAIRSL